MDAVVRETQEEIGVKIDIDKAEFAAKYQVGPDRIVYLYFYDFSGCDDEFYFDDKEVERVEWVDYKEYEKFAISAPVKKVLKEDEIFELYLKKWCEKIREKYGDL